MKNLLYRANFETVRAFTEFPLGGKNLATIQIQTTEPNLLAGIPIQIYGWSTYCKGSYDLN